MNATAPKLGFASDYMEGAHPDLLARLADTNLIPAAGYGADEFSESARAKIRAACCAPDADIYFLAGGTQANAVVLDALLAPYQGVIAADTGHIAGHEAGAIEHGGHKVITVPHASGKLTAAQVDACARSWEQDANREHIVMPGAVYISQPTEHGTLYSLAELEDIARACREHRLAFYVDGARLAYALAADANDVALADLARLADAFYIGGTKCGALLGEAVVFPEHGRVPGFFSIVKQHGALLAKGRVVGVQFDALFTDGLYGRVGRTAVEAADRIRAALAELGYEQPMVAPTNQVFVALDDARAASLAEKVDMGFWERTDDGRTIMRLATSWAVRDEDVDALIGFLRENA